MIWLHRDKGCGDFQLWGTSGGVTNTNVFPLGIPCIGNLSGDTISGRWGDYAGVFPPSPFDPTASNQILYSDGLGSFTIAAQNRTATWMQVAPDARATSFTGVPIEPPPIFPNGSLPQLIPPGGSANFPFLIQNNWPQTVQGVAVAAASPVQITATLVFSFGPTARISQTVVLARPEQAFVPLAEKGWGSGW